MKDTQPHGFTDKSFEFLEGLAANNDRDWFNEHKPTFQEYLETPFANLLEALSNRLADADVTLEGSKKTMFRMNRDVRFSEDKSPYKTAVSGLLTRDGTKKEMGGIVYVHMDAGGGFAGTGWHNLQAKQLAPMRDKIVEKAEHFDDVLAALDEAGLALDTDNSLSSMPRGYTEHEDHRHAEKIKLKSFLIRMDLPKVAWTSGDVVDRVEGLARGAMPLLRFFA
ncbi:MAG: TIGR02453 family protein [Pseudomonadota bacterium]